MADATAVTCAALEYLDEASKTCNTNIPAIIALLFTVLNAVALLWWGLVMYKLGKMEWEHRYELSERCPFTGAKKSGLFVPLFQCSRCACYVNGTVFLPDVLDGIDMVLDYNYVCTDEIEEYSEEWEDGWMQCAACHSLTIGEEGGAVAVSVAVVSRDSVLLELATHFAAPRSFPRASSPS